MQKAPAILTLRCQKSQQKGNVKETQMPSKHNAFRSLQAHFHFGIIIETSRRKAMERVLNPGHGYLENPAEGLLSNDAQGYHLRAGMRLAQNRKLEAIADLKIAKEKDPQYPHSYWMLGLIYGQDNRSLALEELKIALELFQRQGRQEMVEGVTTAIKKIETSD
jgi:tetratricopeptide (TPR) repeat protein